MRNLFELMLSMGVMALFFAAVFFYPHEYVMARKYPGYRQATPREKCTINGVFNGRMYPIKVAGPFLLPAGVGLVVLGGLGLLLS
jgi:hypothetical protein